MLGTNPPDDAITPVRCHDITVSLGTKQVPEFERLLVIGMAVRLALHLRGVPAVDYDLLKLVALHVLGIPVLALHAVVQLLAEVDFIRVDSRGSTVKSIIPNVPYYDVFEDMGKYTDVGKLSEPEQLSLELMERLAKSPTPKDTIYNLGAEPKLVNRMLHVGAEGGYIIGKRARGRDMLVSPVYFSENAAAFADLAAGAGSGRVGRVLNVLAASRVEV